MMKAQNMTNGVGVEVDPSDVDESEIRNGIFESFWLQSLAT